MCDIQCCVWVRLLRSLGSGFRITILVGCESISLALCRAELMESYRVLLLDHQSNNRVERLLPSVNQWD